MSIHNEKQWPRLWQGRQLPEGGLMDAATHAAKSAHGSPILVTRREFSRLAAVQIKGEGWALLTPEHARQLADHLNTLADEIEG